MSGRTKRMVLLAVVAMASCAGGAARAAYDQPSTSSTDGGPVTLASSVSVTNNASTLGASNDGVFDYVYDSSTGDVKIQYDGDPNINASTPLATLKINSASGQINATVAAAHRPAAISSGTSTTTNTDINWSFLQASDGTFQDGFDFGNILPAGLSTTAVLNDLSLWYARSGVIGQTTADLVTKASAAPEPTSLALVGLAGMGLMARRRRAAR